MQFDKWLIIAEDGIEGRVRAYSKPAPPSENDFYKIRGSEG